MSIDATEISLTTHTHVIIHYCLYNIRFCRLTFSTKSAVNVDGCIKLWLGDLGDHTDFFRTKSKHGTTVGQPSAWQLMWYVCKAETPQRKSVTLNHSSLRARRAAMLFQIRMFSAALWDYSHPWVWVSVAWGLKWKLVLLVKENIIICDFSIITWSTHAINQAACTLNWLPCDILITWSLCG